MTVTTAAAPVDRIEPRSLAERLARRDPPLVLDVRRSDRWREDRERIPGAIRAALADGVCDAPCPIVPRMSVTVGDVVLGVVGSGARHAVALVGPSVSVGARLLKRVAPGGIIATSDVVDALRDEMPELARDFRMRDGAYEVPGADGLTVATWTLE